MPDIHGLPDLLSACANVGHTVHVNQAVGAAARPAQKAPGPVVLEAPAQDGHTCGVESGSNCVALMGVDSPAIKLKLQRFVAVNQLSGLGLESLVVAIAGHSSTSPSLLKGCWGDFRLGEYNARDCSRPQSFLYLVAHSVAQGEEPLTATIAVVPPFSLHAGHVALVVEIPDPIVRRAVGRRPGRCFAAEAEFMDVSFPTVGAV